MGRSTFLPALGAGAPAGAAALPLRLLRADRQFPGGSVEVTYTPGD